MNGLDMNHLNSYSDKELVVFLEIGTDPLLKDICRRLSTRVHLEEEKRELEEEVEGQTNRAQKAENKIIKLKDALSDMTTSRDGFQMAYQALKNAWPAGHEMPKASHGLQAMRCRRHLSRAWPPDAHARFQTRSAASRPLRRGHPNHGP